MRIYKKSKNKLIFKIKLNLCVFLLGMELNFNKKYKVIKMFVDVKSQNLNWLTGYPAAVSFLIRSAYPWQ